MKKEYPLVVIGAGEAAISAALSAARQGIKVALLDDQVIPEDQAIQELHQADVDFFHGSSVWYLDQHREIGVLHETGRRNLYAERIVIATAAQERPMPFPGWELSGVISAHEAQALVKSGATPPKDRVVLAGHGSLLLSLAQRLLDAGVQIEAMLDSGVSDTTPATGKLDKEMPWHRIENLRARGDSNLKEIEFVVDGESKRIEAGLLVTHNGLVPEIRLAQTAGCAIDWNQQQQYWQVRVDARGESSQPGIFILEDSSYDPAGIEFALDDDSVICKCESVRLAELKAVIAMGCTGPNQAKAFTRCGMGACQGQYCAVSVEQEFTRQLGMPVAEIGHFRARPPLKPITLGQLANSGEIES